MARGGGGCLDIEAEYCATYGHHPSTVDGLTWPEFIGLSRRANRFAVRRLLEGINSTAGGIGRAFSGNDAKARSDLASLERLAYPDD